MPNITPHLLLSSFRNRVIDEQYFGFAFLFDNCSCISSYGKDNGSKFFLRSLSKPVQASLMQDFDLHNALKLSQKEIAICCASHSGTGVHIELVKNILKKSKLDETFLKCPPAEPLDKKDYDGFKKPIYHNCSAKHALMLAICKCNNWSLDNYLDFDHPLQIMIKNRHLELSGAKEIEISLDGCGAPVFALTISEIAKMFFNFLNDEKYAFILNAIVNNPYEFGGNDRLDSEIVSLGASNLVAKVGAGGFVLVYNREKDMILIVKMSQNNNLPRRIITLNALYQLGWIGQNPSPVEYFNDWGKKVGDYVCNFSFS